MVIDHVCVNYKILTMYLSPLLHCFNERYLSTLAIVGFETSHLAGIKILSSNLNLCCRLQCWLWGNLVDSSGSKTYLVSLLLWTTCQQHPPPPPPQQNNTHKRRKLGILMIAVLQHCLFISVKISLLENEHTAYFSLFYLRSIKFTGFATFVIPLVQYLHCGLPFGVSL